jgi:hypothetical protein
MFYILNANYLIGVDELLFLAGHTPFSRLQGGELYKYQYKQERCEKMRFILFWEFNPEDMDKANAMEKALIEERTKYPEKYPKDVTPMHPYLDGYCRGLQIVEGDQDQLRRLVHFMFPEVKIKFIPAWSREEGRGIYQEIQGTRKQHGLPTYAYEP